MIGLAPSAPGFAITGGSYPPIPGRLRMADVDQDSFIDIVLSISFYNSTSLSEVTLTAVMMNMEGNTTLTDGNTRTLEQTTDSSLYNSLSVQAGKSTQFVTFLDVAQNGRLDVILQKVD